MTDETKRKQGPQTYVVQQEQTVKVATGDDAAGYKTESRAFWRDLATVTVPPRTPRKAVVKQALAEAEVRPEGKLRVRVLDAESAEVFEPEAKQPEPEWVIG
jgi:hypothetical protein